MKKIINKSENVVNETLRGFALAHPNVTLLSKYKVIRRKTLNPEKVCLISGGGSGHEPAHSGFVGLGMLDAAVSGDIFASPSQIQIYQAIKHTAGKRGVLLIIKNYSGDVMNFKNAAQLAQEDGIQVDYVIVDDDIAVQDSLYTVGRRGVAGTLFVHKLTGAAAERGDSLEQVKAVAEKTTANVRSIGFALTSCTAPAKGSPTFELEDDMLEYGVGIHGEPGVKRIPFENADALAKRMTASLCDELKLIGSDASVAVMINGFGATPVMELYLFNNAVRRELAAYGVSVFREFVGNYMTSIDMAGASISILRLDKELEALLDAPADTPALRVDGAVSVTQYEAPWSVSISDANFSVETPEKFAVLADELTLSNIIYIVDVMCESIIRNETFFCELDSHAGDGDFGMSLAKGFRQLKREWSAILSQNNLNIGSFLDACSMVIMENCGGASGPVWGSAFRAAAKQAYGKEALSVADVSELLYSAVRGIQRTGERAFGRGAVVGDKTLIDALIPCAGAWAACASRNEGLAEGFRAGAVATADGAKATEKIVARMGRAGNVGERSLGYPDAGAYGLGVIFADIVTALSTK